MDPNSAPLGPAARAVRSPEAKARRLALAFDAGQNGRRLRSLPTSADAINSQIRRYGRTILARSRYLASNNPYAAAAKEAFVSALVGSGIKPSPMVDAGLKAELQQLWLDWTDEADADWLTDLYGLQAIIAAEMFEAGECFVRFRVRRPEDSLSVPLQLQVLPAEMLPLEHNESARGGRNIQCGIEFDGIGRRKAYHFLRQHPNDDAVNLGRVSAGQKTIVPADEVLHLYRPVRAGQIRGLPHTLSAIVKLAIMDQYDDAELERKRTAALFGAFVTRPVVGDDPMAGPLGGETTGAEASEDEVPLNSIGLEPGATIDLLPGEDVKFAAPADVGNSYEAFQYRTLLAIAAGFGVPYAAMTGDLRQTSYGSIRAGLVEFRRRVEAMQHHVMVFQFCRPVWLRFLTEAVLARAVNIAPRDFVKRRREFARVKWMTPKWDWIDPLKDLQAEKLAVDSGFKARSDVIEAIGDDREATDKRIAADRDSADQYELKFGEAPPAPPDEEDDDDGENPPPPPTPSQDQGG
jgi:lambda family phage portal protein